MDASNAVLVQANSILRSREASNCSCVVPMRVGVSPQMVGVSPQMVVVFCSLLYFILCTFRPFLLPSPHLLFPQEVEEGFALACVGSVEDLSLSKMTSSLSCSLLVALSVSRRTMDSFKPSCPPCISTSKL